MDEYTKESRQNGPKARKSAKHYGTQGGEHRPAKGGGYRRPNNNVRWDEVEDHDDLD